MESEDLSAYCTDCLKRNRRVLADRNGLCRLCYQNKSDNDLASPHPGFNTRREEEAPLPKIAGSFEPKEPQWQNIPRPGPPDMGPRSWRPTAMPAKARPNPAPRPQQAQTQKLAIKAEPKPQPAPPPRSQPSPPPPERKHKPTAELRQVLSFEAVEAALALLLREMDENLEVLSMPQVRAFVRKLGDKERKKLEDLQIEIALRALEIRTLR